MGEHLEAGLALSADERMRVALMAILNRVESAEDLTYGKLPGYAYAIALEATEALSEAYPDDPLYQRLRFEWEARAKAPYCIPRRRDKP